MPPRDLDRSRQQEVVPHRYEIPEVRLLRSRYVPVLLVTFLIVLGWAFYRAMSVDRAFHGDDASALLWTALFLAAGHQIALAWFDRPFTVTLEQQVNLDQLYVTVNVPLYNEDAAVIDRTIYALFRQSRLPNRIQVVDDGSTAGNYAEIRDYWLRHAPRGVDFSWIRTKNGGKRHAQAVTFHNDYVADVFATLDSDTALARNAIEEALKPFVDPRVQSVAGVEVAYNAHANLLTRLSSIRQIAWQMTQCCVLSMAGNVLVNRGTFAMYRAPVIRDNLDLYLNEKFLGKQVRYSDDSLLTLFALKRGRAVQQLTAYQLPMYPENVGHALRQWVRWMRGSTIRNIWRLRYLPVFSYGWLMSVLSWWQFFVSWAAYLMVFVVRPTEGHFSIAPVLIILLSSYLVALRNLLIRRSDHSPLQTLDTWLLAPLNLVWSLVVLRPARIYGTLTCSNNGWGTRGKVEVGIASGNALPPGRTNALSGGRTGVRK
jgi:hyaluronan synthase